MYRSPFKGESSDEKRRWRLANILCRIEAIKKLYPLYRRRTPEDYILKIKKEMLQIRKHCALMDYLIRDFENDMGVEYPNKKNIKQILAKKFKVGKL